MEIVITGRRHPIRGDLLKAKKKKQSEEHHRIRKYWK